VRRKKEGEGGKWEGGEERRRGRKSGQQIEWMKGRREKSRREGEGAGGGNDLESHLLV
jgi:hypothetical protein